MKNWFSKLLLTSLNLGILFFSFSIQAEVLNDDFDLNCLKGLKFGYYMCGLPLKENRYGDTVGALMALKANSFLEALRGIINLSHVDGKIYDRSIRAFIPSKDSSSTEVRNAIKNQKPFEQFLSFPVQAIIKQEGLYTKI
jgi:hypothetical protein